VGLTVKEMHSLFQSLWCIFSSKLNEHLNL